MGTCYFQDITDKLLKFGNGAYSITVIWLTAAHIPGKDNTVADKKSCKIRKETGETHNAIVFQDAIAKLGITPDIDLFASKLNYNCKPYIFYHPDPEAYAVNASMYHGRTIAFMPFPHLQRV